MSWFKDLRNFVPRRLLTLYYALNFITALIFYPCIRMIPMLKSIFLPNLPSSLIDEEIQIIMFCLVIVVLKTRKSPEIDNQLGTIFLFAKASVLALFFIHNVYLAFGYALWVLVLFVVFPQPIYSGPTKYVNVSARSLHEQLTADKSQAKSGKADKKKLLLMMYAPWSSPCNQLDPVFAELSLERSSPNLRFAKVDISRMPRVATLYNINVSVTSKQLPSLILFIDGEEHSRAPTFMPGSTTKVDQFVFSEDNITKYFQL